MHIVTKIKSIYFLTIILPFIVYIYYFIINCIYSGIKKDTILKEQYLNSYIYFKFTLLVKTSYPVYANANVPTNNLSCPSAVTVASANSLLCGVI